VEAAVIERMTDLNSTRIARLSPNISITSVAWISLSVGLLAAADGAVSAEPASGRTIPAILERTTSSSRPSATIGFELANVAAASFEPPAGNLVDLATFGASRGSAALNVPAPGALSPVTPPKDHIPEPGTIGFGLAVLALVFGNIMKSFMKCWRMTSIRVGSGRD
jgi:hypothetical protein